MSLCTHCKHPIERCTCPAYGHGQSYDLTCPECGMPDSMTFGSVPGSVFCQHCRRESPHPDLAHLKEGSDADRQWWADLMSDPNERVAVTISKRDPNAELPAAVVSTGQRPVPIHIVREADELAGRILCGDGDLPPGDRWCFERDAESATCPECKRLARRAEVLSFMAELGPLETTVLAENPGTITNESAEDWFQRGREAERAQNAVDMAAANERIRILEQERHFYTEANKRVRADARKMMAANLKNILKLAEISSDRNYLAKTIAELAEAYAKKTP